MVDKKQAQIYLSSGIRELTLATAAAESHNFEQPEKEQQEIALCY